jgi:hypothetical protein
MYTYRAMVASRPSNVSGLDMFNFSSYWNTIKNKINELQQLGYTISLHQQKLGVAYSSLKARGRDDVAEQLQDEIAKTQDDLNKWWKVKGYIDTYLPEWAKADQPGAVVTNNLSVLPVVMGAAAIAALAYVVNTGMALLQDYAFKSKLTAAVIEQKMTSGQAAEILSVPREKGVIEEVVSKVGTGLGFGLPVLLLVGGGLYLVITTGMLKGLFGSSQS